MSTFFADHGRPCRGNFGPMVDIAQQAATEILRKAGMTCLFMEPGQTGVAITKVTRRSLEALPMAGQRMWLRSTHEADRSLIELYASSRDVFLVPKGGKPPMLSAVKVHAHIREVEERLISCARRLGLAPTEDQHVQITLTSLEQRISGALEGMQKSGQMKQVNREYRAVREGAAKGAAPVPAYSKWLLDRLLTELSRCA